MLLQSELDGHFYRKIAVSSIFLELLCMRCKAHESIHHQSSILLSRYSSQSCNIICLDHPAPEKAQCAQSSAHEKSSSSTGTK